MKNSVVLLVVAVFLVSCNSFTKKDTQNLEMKTVEATDHPGKTLMEVNCYACHSPSAGENNRIGPPMIAIKKRYIGANTSKDEFITSMQTWIENPNAEDAKMYGAVSQFGVMPKLAFPEETISQIADYMYDFDIEQPEWFEAHYQNQKGHGMMGQGNGQQNRKGMGQATPTEDNVTYGDRGLKYALSTKAVLGKNLMGTIQEKGVLEALAFCNEQAYPLTDSMAVVHHATIKRVSDKPRNPNNAANTEEVAFINTFKEVIANTDEPSPIVKETATNVKVYFPITTNAMCLQCHGKPNETMDKSTLTKVLNLYPNDKAIGYNENEVRGIWSISFDK